MASIEPIRRPEDLLRNRPWQDLLTRREATVAALVALGWTNQEISDGLVVEESTVKFHLSNCYVKLSLRGRIELARWWWVNVERPQRFAPEADRG